MVARGSILKTLSACRY